MSDWRDRWSEDGEEGYEDATERLPRTGDGGRGGDDADEFGEFDELDAGRPDPVRDFFAAHRAQVEEHDADDLTWQHIQRQARVADGSRRRAWLTGAGVAASAAVLGLVLTQAFNGGDESPQPAPPPSITATDDAPVTDLPTQTDEPDQTVPDTQGAVSPAPPATVEPPATTDVTGEATDDVPDDGATTGDPAAPSTDPGEEPEEPEQPEGPPVLDAGWVNPPMGLGEQIASTRTVACEGGADLSCSVLYLSEDGGQTWGEPIDLEPFGIVGVDRTEDHLWGWGPGGLKRSDDLGATWTDVAHRGAQVLQVTTWPDAIVVVTGDCSTTYCAGVEVTVLPPDADDATEGTATALGDLGTMPATARRTQTAFYLTVPGQVPEEAQLWRVPVDGGEGTSMVPAQQCSGGPFVQGTVAVVPRSEDDLLMACKGFDVGGSGGDTTQVELLRSADGGQTWSPLAAPLLQTERVCGLASGDGQDIVMATLEGVLVSHDGGETFATTVEHPASEECRMSDLGFGSGTTYTARAGSGDGTGNPAAYYRSDDAGESWRYVIVD